MKVLPWRPSTDAGFLAVMELECSTDHTVISEKLMHILEWFGWEMC